MPMEGHLYLDTTASPEEIKAHLLRTMPYEDEPDFLEFKCLISRATSLMVRRSSDSVTLEAYPDRFSIDAKLYVFFQHQDDGEIDEDVDWIDETIQATLSLLRRFAGNAALMLFTDVPVLLRRDGALKLLYRQGGIWDARSHASRLSLVDLPYTVEPLSQYRW